MKIDVTVLSEYRDDDLSYIQTVITPEFARRVKSLARTVEKAKAYQITLWDTPEFLTGEDKEAEARIDSSSLCVSKDDFHWEGDIKHTECLWESDYVTFKVIDEVLKVANCRRKNLPLLIGKLEYEDAQNLLEKRMKTK